MAADLRMKAIHDDLQHTAADLERVSLDLRGHVLYLQHSVHQADAAAVLGRIAGLQSSVDDLRGVAETISY
ncbi:hypothetical protein D3C81_517320 [compost metagenome]|uniref:Uncharacterized protein n=2 Tax=Pseudomonas TaxID=286 RepID=A0A380T0C5_9PSED|nr:hypothetical protein CCOS864_02923 [Pseudomonas wadenswilerensis]